MTRRQASSSVRERVETRAQDQRPAVKRSDADASRQEGCGRVERAREAQATRAPRFASRTTLSLERMASSAPTDAPQAAHDQDYEALTNTLRPLTDCFLTIRIIKSFTFRTTKNLLLPHVDCTTTTVGQLKDLCRERTSPLAGSALCAR